MPPRKQATVKTMSAKAAAAPSATAAAKKAAATKKTPAPKAAAAAQAKTNGTAVTAKETKPAPLKKTTNKRKSPADDDADEIENGSQPKKQKTAAKPVAKPAAKSVATKKAASAGTKAPAKSKVTRKKTPAPAEHQVPDIEDKENAVPAGSLPAGNKKRAATAESESAKEVAKKPEAKPAKARPVKKTKVAAAPKAPHVKFGAKINDAPAKPLEVFVFGEGSSGELGLGSVRTDGKRPIDVKRPRLNTNLSAQKVGVVQIAAGGMHSVVLTKDNKILTWGVNDQGALGRDTTWDGGLRDASDDSDSDDDDDTGLNPQESNPAEIDLTDIAEGTKFVQVAASDSASFALTEDGRVYGWGTFRASDGVLGFTKDILVRRTPMLLQEPKKVKQLAVGSNHILALDERGKVFTWGCPEQNQLGRRCVQRDMKESALRPGGVGFKRGTHIKKVACGSYHSFALDAAGQVYAWGLNNFAELGLREGAGDSDAAVLDATLITALSEHNIVDIAGGEHHSLACTEDGKLLTWGRIDGHQVGIDKDALAEDDVIYDEHKKPRILAKPTVVQDVPFVVAVAAGTDNSFALTRDGKVYSWGFSANYQTGQGTSEDIEIPTVIDNTAVRDKKLVYAGAGGQYSVLASYANDVEMVNGV